MAQVRTKCETHGDVQVNHDEIVIDDLESVYRLTCPSAGGHPLAKRFDAKIRALLRGAGVRTVEEIVESATLELSDDEEIWRNVESST